jgi:hypothetical protein
MTSNVFPGTARPIWAVRLATGTFTLSFLLLTLSLMPGYRCVLVRSSIGIFGLGWLFLGLFSACFCWALPRRGGRGCYSPTSRRAIWLIFCTGFVLLGLQCIVASLGYLPIGFKGCP